MSYLDTLFGLNGKVAIVTGGGRGIGQVIARGLAQAGAEVVILSRSGADETLRLIAEDGGKSYFIATDVTQEQSVDHAMAEILRQSVQSISSSITRASACTRQRLKLPLRISARSSTST